MMYAKFKHSTELSDTLYQHKNNYWPISVISVVTKVFERIVYDQLYEPHK